MYKYKLAIFDLDGTLLNTLDDLATACNFALSKQGFPTHDFDKYKFYIGNGPVKLVTNALPENQRDDDTVKKTRALFLDYYNAHSTDLTKPYDGAIEVLKTLKDSGVKVAVYSNKQHENVVQLSDKYFGDLVDLAVGFRDTMPAKPDPTVGIEIIERFAVSTADAVYLGDSGVDMETAVRLGVYPVGALWGYRPKDELVKAGAQVVLHKISEFCDLLVDKS